LGCAGVGKNMGFDVVAGESYELRLSEMNATSASVLVMPIGGPVITSPPRPAATSAK
jgi:hypothetical protein